MNKKIILVSHGKLSEGMLHSVQMIVGKRDDICCYGMMPGEHYNPMVDHIEKEAVEHPGTQYIVIADLLGGSVCNGMMTLVHHPNLKLLAGMNMGLVINLLLEPEAVSDEQIECKLGEAKDIITFVKPDILEAADDSEDFF